ncbi:MAG: low molecular weight phosphatase family protein [Thermoplasmata archaeon]|nr:low molecular weight phosphatase family protein [Thermoplasmata archaeon]
MLRRVDLLPGRHPAQRLLCRRRLLLLLLPLLLMAEHRVLFVCVENSCRSLMAEAIFNANPAPGWSALSAGTNPAAAANPRTQPMLAEIGLAAPEHAPRLLSTADIDEAQVRVTMGCLDDSSCPVHLKMQELRDWGLEDPAALDDDGFRHVRDRIVRLVRGLRTELILSDQQAAALASSARR